MAKSNLDLKKIANVLKKFQNELTPSKQEMKDLSLVPTTRTFITIDRQFMTTALALGHPNRPEVRPHPREQLC